MNQQRVQTSQANKIKGKTTWRTGCVCGGGRSHQYNRTSWGSAASLLLLVAVAYHSSFLQIVSVKQNHKPVRENCTSKRSSKWCDAEINFSYAELKPTNTRSKPCKELEQPGKFDSTGHVLLHILHGEKVGPNTTIGQPCQTGNHASPTKIKTSLLNLTSGPIAELRTISK